MKCDSCGGTSFDRIGADDLGFERYTCTKCSALKIFQVVPRRKKRNT